jgi:predicted transcriptional regulator
MKKKPTRSKVDTVSALCGRKTGTTISEIVKRLNVSAVAASSLIGDARRKGVKVKHEDGRYYA